MEITLGMICLGLEKYYKISSNIPVDRDWPIQGFQIWEKDCSEQNVLYVVSEENLAERQSWKNKKIIGIRCNKVKMGRGGLYISVEEPVELIQLVNTLQKIFQEFFCWKLRMERMFYRREGFKEILNELEQTYGIIAVLVDKNLKCIALSNSYSLYNCWMGDDMEMTLESINDLMEDDNFRVAIQHDRAFWYYDVTEATCASCYNIKVHGQYEARLLIQNKEQRMFFGGLALVEYIGKHITEMFVYHRNEKNQEMVLYDFYDILKELLKGTPKSEKEIKKHLTVRGWKRDHIYQVLLFHFMEESASVTKRFYQSKMETLFCECCVLVVGKRLCCIRNLSMTDTKDWDVRQVLSVFLRENLCKAGISQRFTDISLLHDYYVEAENALELGMDSNSTWWYYPFDKMVLPYIWKQAVGEISEQQLYHPGIRTLLLYDEKEGSEMVRTVYEYMRHRYNVTQTANALFIHRTTMLFRLQRIEVLTGIDWESWEERIQLAITFELMRKKSGTQP